MKENSISKKDIKKYNGKRAKIASETKLNEQNEDACVNSDANSASCQKSTISRVKDKKLTQNIKNKIILPSVTSKQLHQLDIEKKNPDDEKGIR